MLNYLSDSSWNHPGLYLHLTHSILLLLSIIYLKENSTIYLTLLSLPLLSSTHKLTHYSYILASFFSPSLLSSILHFTIHNLNHRPSSEYIISSLIRLYFLNFPTDLLLLLIFLLVLTVTIQKDFHNFSTLSYLYQKLYKEKENITNALEVAVVFIDIHGKVLKNNLKAEVMFGKIQNKNFYEVLPSEKVSRVQEMVKISQQKLIPEEDFNYLIPDYGKIYFILSMKCVPLDNNNAFLLHFVDMNLTAKKRMMVMKSYQSNLILQSKTIQKFEQRYSQGARITLKDFTTFVKYVYAQQETISITQLATGQVYCYHVSFDLKHEVSNMIQFYWSQLEKNKVRVSLNCQGNIGIVLGDKTKHHLLIRSFLHYIGQVAKPSTDLKITLSKLKSPIEGLYKLNYRFTFEINPNLSPDLLLVLTRPEEDLDNIYYIQHKYDLIVCLLPWLVQMLGGSIDRVIEKSGKVKVNFHLSFNEGDALAMKQLYLIERNDCVEVFNWPAVPSGVNRTPISIFKLRRKIQAGLDLPRVVEECKD